MAPSCPTLTSNSFLQTPHYYQKQSFRNQKLTVFAKKAEPLFPFNLGKSKEDNSSQSDETSSGNSKPFNFNFGKVSADVKSLIPAVVSKPAASGLSLTRRKDAGTVFVAGATGQAGIRIAQALLRQGFSVRAGVPELNAAQQLARFASDYKIISKEESRRLNAVESAFKNPESMAKAIGNASKVVVTIGPTENGPTSEVSTVDALQVVKAAALAGVSHIAIIYDGNTLNASTYNVLDGITSFFNNLFSQAQLLSVPEFLQKVIETDVSYTFIKTSLTEDFSPESSYNVVLATEGSASPNDYKVARSQIASVVANVFSNTAVAENKVVEVFTDPSAPSKSVEVLLSTIPEDGRRKAYAESLTKKTAEEEARTAAEKAREASVASQKLEEEVKKLSRQEAKAAKLAEEAAEKAEAAGTTMDNLLTKAKDFGAGLSWTSFSEQISSAVKSNSEELKVQVATVRGQAKARALPSLKAFVKPPSTKAKPKAKEPTKVNVKQTEGKPEVRKVFGGLFQQETIYVDDD